MPTGATGLVIVMLLAQAQHSSFKLLAREGYFFDPTADVIATIPSGGVVFTLTDPSANISIWQNSPKSNGYTNIIESIESPCVSSFDIGDDGNRMTYTCDRSDEIGDDYLHLFFERSDKDATFIYSGCEFSTAHLRGAPAKQPRHNAEDACTIEHWKKR